MKVMYGTQSGFITRDSVSLVMDASEFKQFQRMLENILKAIKAIPAHT